MVVTIVVVVDVVVVVVQGLVMAGRLMALACARPSALPCASPPTTPGITSQHCSQSLPGIAIRRPRLGLGKQFESDYGLCGNQLKRSQPVNAIFGSDTNSSASASDNDDDLPPAGCSRIKLELKKPLGIAFEEDKFGNVMVGEVIEGGNAYKSGLVDAGDQLIATSAIVYSSEDEYQGVVVRKGMQKVRLNVRGERFETVIAAIGTHPYYIPVALEFQKCKPVVAESANGSATS